MHDVHFSSKTVEWATPRDFFDRLDAEFHFTLDPCATPESAKCEKFYTVQQNGLAQDWTGERVFCNPPYSDVASWIEKCATANAEIVAMLIPARTDTRSWHRYIIPFAGINSGDGFYAWVAGIIDGEGCIRIDKNNPTTANRLVNPGYALCVSVKMTDFATIERLHRRFGGSISDELRTEQRCLKRWEVRGDRAFQMLEYVYPHLFTKQIQARMGMEFHQHRVSVAKGKATAINFLEWEIAYKEISEVKKEQSVRPQTVEVRFIKGRLKFNGHRNSAPFPCAVVIFRKVTPD